MNISPRSVAIVAVCLVALARPAPLRAAGVGSLRSPYSGPAFSRSSAAAGTIVLTLTPAGGGNVTGVFGGFPIKGKISAAGKFAFSGKFSSDTGSVKVTDGKGQLSATGGFILGTVTLTGTGSFAAETGKYIYSETSQAIKHALSSEPHGPIPAYSGRTHDNKNASAEDVPSHFAVINNTFTQGPFTGSFDDVPVTGKVTAAGKVTFKGTLKAGSATLKVQGSGFISGNQNAFMGTFTAKGKGSLANRSGAGTFEYTTG